MLQSPDKYLLSTYWLLCLTRSHKQDMNSANESLDFVQSLLCWDYRSPLALIPRLKEKSNVSGQVLDAGSTICPFPMVQMTPLVDALCLPGAADKNSRDEPP